ncbi:hypothetical protein BC937DRAFT_93386 [Endogone sp. FLAS-F59071]|nr:hypothetical protein BC937DRAFT_93386 [Endogone sp. FLAS-F59071]|eukprot:RUS21187.1 hypothetical protein BC937DRAFT_93386 [Endogone sp. FLAS-F59071]
MAGSDTTRKTTTSSYRPLTALPPNATANTPASLTSFLSSSSTFSLDAATPNSSSNTSCTNSTDLLCTLPDILPIACLDGTLQCFSKSSGPNVAAIVGGTVAAAVVASLAAVFLLFFLRRRSRLKGGGAGESEEEDIKRPTYLPIDATDMTYAQIQTGLNNIATDIKSIAAKAGASEFDPSRAASIIKSAQTNQGGMQQVLPTTKVEAIQALQASVAMVLATRVLPKGNVNMLAHPLFDDNTRQKEFRQWVANQSAYAGREDFMGQRKRQWAAKYVRENIASDASLSARRDKLITDTTGAIQNAIAVLYPGLEDELRERIEKLVRSALELTIEMMGRDLPIIAKWARPGETFSEDSMEMTDISKIEGVVALCIFPRWMDSEGFTITKARVYCAAATAHEEYTKTRKEYTKTQEDDTKTQGEDTKTQVDEEDNYQTN